MLFAPDRHSDPGDCFNDVNRQPSAGCLVQTECFREFEYRAGFA